jgi:predicted transcriptional regulator
MKTAISVPDDVFESAEQLARRERRSRSEIYSTALREYVARHAPDEITDALDRVVTAVGTSPDPFVKRAAERSLAASDW